MTLRKLKAAVNHWEKLVGKSGFWRISIGEKLVRENNFLEVFGERWREWRTIE